MSRDLNNSVTVRYVSDMHFYMGEQALPGIKFHLAGDELGVSAWGMNVLSLEPGCNYPEHDHKSDEQEEVYVVLSGSAVLVADGVEYKIRERGFVRVGPQIRRKFVPDDGGAVILAIGGVPGRPYKS